MEHELFTRISKEFHTQERKVAIKASLCAKINPIILVAYILLLSADRILYFRSLFANGHPRSGWLSLGILIAIPFVLTLLHKFLRSMLYAKAEAVCTVSIPEWHPDRFENMDAILGEKDRLRRKYTIPFWPPLFGLILPPAVVVLCYRYAAALAESPAPERIGIQLFLMGIFYAIYGFLVTICCGENTVPPLSHEVRAAVRSHAKSQGRVVKEARRISEEDRAAFDKARRLDEMVDKALRQTPPNIKLLFSAASEGAERAIAPIGRALVPLLMENYPEPYALEKSDNKRRAYYDALVADFEKYAVPLAEAGNPELEFALMAARYYCHRPIRWYVLRDQAIPRVKELMSTKTILNQWGDIPKQYLASMEYTVGIFERSPNDLSGASDEASLSDPVHDDLTAIQKSLAQIGLCDPPPDLTTDV